MSVETLEVRIGLTSSHKHDGLTSSVGHGDGGADLIVDRVELGQHDAVNGSRLLASAFEWTVVDQGLIELSHLIHGFVADQGFANEQHQVRIIDVDELKKRDRY